MEHLSTAAAERLTLGLTLGLVALAALAPATHLPAHYHHFADQRALGGLPFAMDVLTNLPFALAGAWGLAWLRRATGLAQPQRALAALFFAGLALTALCSGIYHLHPENAGLALDRAGMAVAFAGVVGLAAADRVSGRRGPGAGRAAFGAGAAGGRVGLAHGQHDALGRAASGRRAAAGAAGAAPPAQSVQSGCKGSRRSAGLFHAGRAGHLCPCQGAGDGRSRGVSRAAWRDFRPQPQARGRCGGGLAGAGGAQKAARAQLDTLTQSTRSGYTLSTRQNFKKR